MGVTKTITDQAGKKRKGVTDALGRMVRVIEDPTGQNLSTDYQFDTLGNLRKTMQGEQSRYFTYDSLGRLLYAKQPEQEANTSFSYTDSITNNTQWSIKYEYDDNGNITKTTDARGVYVEGSYDNFNRLKLRNYSDDTPDVTFYYDGRGLGSIPNFSKGKTTRVASSVSETRYTSFDNQGRLLTSEQRTPFGTETPENATPQVSSYNYDAYGKLVSQTYPSGRTVKIDYDRDGDMASLWGTVGSQNRLYANGISYNSAGSIERMRLGNGKWESAKYNSREQIIEIGLGHSADDKSLLRLEYGYGTNTQNNGSLRTQKISFSGLSQPFEQTYSYDDLNRLLSAEEKVNNSTTWKQTFQYDRYGNRRFNAGQTTTLAQSTNVTNPEISTSTNRLTTGYSYDKAGNLTVDAENRRFVYDAENHQTKLFDSTNNTSSPDAIYQYDGDGKRVRKISSTETVIFVYDGGGQLVAEYSTQLAETPQVSYLTSDHLGSPRVITNESGQVTNRKDYMAFGEETQTAQRTTQLKYENQTETRKGYTGYEKDAESGLDFAQARYYNSSHGRFTSVDPLTASANVKNPQTFNRYSYVLNSPYKYVDPLGLIASTTGACGQWCPGVRSGGEIPWDDMDGYKQPETQTTDPTEPPPNHSAEQNEEKPKPPRRPHAPKFIVVCKTGSKCSPETVKKGQRILDTLVMDNWNIIYDLAAAEAAKNRLPEGEVTEKSSTITGELGLNPSGPEAKGGGSKSEKTEIPKSLPNKLQKVQDYLTNNAAAVQSLEQIGVTNPGEIVAKFNQMAIDEADRLLSISDQSPAMRGTLPVRRADPNNVNLGKPKVISPGDKIRYKIRAADRSIYQE